MPAFGVPVDKDIKEKAAAYKALLQEVEREWRKTQRQLLKEIKEGKAVDPKLAERSTDLRRQADGYRKKAEEQKRVEKTAKTTVAQQINRLLDTHNPHGQFRQLASGNPGALTRGFAVGAIVAKVTKAVFDAMQHRADDQLRAAGIDQQTADAAFQSAFALRHNQDSAVTGHLVNRRRAIDAPTKGHGLIDDYFHGASHDAETRKFRLKASDFAFKYRGILTPQEIAALSNPDNAKHAREVNRKFGLLEKGMVGWIKSNTVDRLTGARDRERDTYAKELTMRRMQAREESIASHKRLIEEDPVYQVAQMERTRAVQAVNRMRFETFQNVNPY